MSHTTTLRHIWMDASKRRQWVWVSAAASPLVIGPAWVALAAVCHINTFAGTLAGFVLVAALLASTYTDLRWRRIPNWVTYTAVSWALAIHVAGAWLGEASRFLGALPISEGLLGFGACLAVSMLIYSCGGSGAGDVKLAAVVGTLVGLPWGVAALVWCYLLAGVAALAYLVLRYGPWAILALIGHRVGSFVLPSRIDPPAQDQQRVLTTPVPMALFLAIATAIVLGRVQP